MSYRLVIAFGVLLVAPMASREAELTNVERNQIAKRVRSCWPQADMAIPADTRVSISIVTEEDGTAIDAASMVSSAKLLAGAFGPAERALSGQAKRAVLDPLCNPLPLPPRLLGHRQSVTLEFGP